MWTLFYLIAIGWNGERVFQSMNHGVESDLYAIICYTDMYIYIDT
jgi:hypothetical protein